MSRATIRKPMREDSPRCRSALSSEAHAAVSAVDVAHWVHVFPTETFAMRYDRDRLTHPKGFAIANPFIESARNRDGQQEAVYRLWVDVPSVIRTDNPFLQRRLSSSIRIVESSAHLPQSARFRGARYKSVTSNRRRLLRQYIRLYSIRWS